MPDPDAPRKPPNRFWLFAPYVALLIAAVGWSVAWVWIRSEVAGRMDAAATRLREAGYAIDWSRRRIDGYPFRIDVTVDDPRLAERSGWALTAPQIRAEAYAYRLDQWIGYAPSGVVLSRPSSGAVAITGPALRASYGGRGPDAPRIAVEGLKLAFTPKPGAAPFMISAAQHLDLHVWQAGGDQAEFLLRIDGAAAPAGGLLAKIAQAQPMDIAWEARLSHASALHGRDWPAAVQAWSAAGGSLRVEHGLLNAGATSLNLNPGSLDVGWDGRLRGGIGLDLTQAPNLIRTLAQASAIDPGAADSAMTVALARSGGGAVTRADLTFIAGAAAFGPVAIGPSPKVY
ncbi:MAG TPA: DUF2125 domain-containing protein [Caulobacteraceae bacterium]|nr:DUF2125 domain-containing protein [Caulobacteraceae bacterium]